MALPPIDLSSGSALALTASSIVVTYVGAQSLPFEATIDTVIGYAGIPSDPGGGNRALTYNDPVILLSLAKDREGLVDVLSALARADQFGVAVTNAVVTFLL